MTNSAMAIPKKNQLVGLDVGSHSIKLVEIDHSKKGPILKNFGIACLPVNAIVEGSIKEPEIVSSAIKNLYKNLKVKNKRVATSISGYSVIVKKIDLPEKQDTDLESAIQEVAEQYIPFDINDVNLDYELIPPATGDKDKQQVRNREVILVAAKKEIVDQYTEMFEMAGLTPAVLDVDAFALQNAFEVSTPDATGCYALVNIGAEELGINAVKNGVSMFTRDSSYGGRQITEALMKKLGVSFEEAEKIKLGGIKLEKDRHVVEDIFTSVVSSWVQEIRRALDFLATTYPDETIERIFLGGGSSRIPGLKKYLQLETGIPVEILNPFSNLIINEKQFDLKYLTYMAPQAAVAVGLAFRSLGDK